MEVFLLVVSILLIIIVLLQSVKAQGATIISGGSSELFTNRKERGSELVITRITMLLGFLFFGLSLISMFI